MKKLMISAAFAAMAFACAPAHANGVQCPDGSWRDDAKWCPLAPQPQPQQPGAVGVGVGVGTGVGIGTGTGVGHGGAGGAGGNGGGGGHGGGGGNATGGTSFGSNQQQGQSAVARNGAITLNSNSRAAAGSAIAPQLGGYGLPNCFGDTNPSGSFSAAYQGLLFGGAAASMKASNICAVYAIGGEEAAMRYLIRMDPAFRDGILSGPVQMPINRPTGRLVCPASHPVYVEGKGCAR